MPNIQFQAQVLGGYLPQVGGRSSRDSRPKLPNLGEMLRPIFDALVEYWSNQTMLPDIRIKVFQQNGNAFALPDPVIKTSIALIYFTHFAPPRT
jgi:hypothetical protein